MDKRFLNTDELAIYLNIKPTTVRAWVKKCKIPYSKLGRCVRFDSQKVNKWLKVQEVKDPQVFL